MTAIIRKEILEHLTTFRFAVLAGLMGVLMLSSLLVGLGDYRLRLENYGIVLPRGAASPSVVIRPNPLSIFVQGLDPRLGKVFELTSLGITVHADQQSINRLFSLFAVPDLLFIVRVVLALMALLLTFDALSGEREDGTLKLLLASGGRRTGLFLGKLAGRFLLVAAPFVLYFSACTLFAATRPDIQADGYFFSRMALVLGVALLYTGVFAAIGLAISSAARRSVTALALCLAAWILLVFVLPALAAEAALTAHPVPDGDRIAMETRQVAIRAIFERIQREKTGRNESEDLRMIGEIREANNRILDSYRPALNRQIGLAGKLLRLSPAGALALLMTDLTNTGIAEELRLKDAIVLHMNRNESRILGIEKTPAEHFQYARAGIALIMEASGAGDVALLLASLLGCTGLGLWLFGRYDVR